MMVSASFNNDSADSGLFFLGVADIFTGLTRLTGLKQDPSGSLDAEALLDRLAVSALLDALAVSAMLDAAPIAAMLGFSFSIDECFFLNLDFAASGTLVLAVQ